ncbi:MAG: energy-coupled thiamine transporter ThiT [Clostridia bacterium]|nr:energy-coupled thiamine transporter ThiT [Clostridia bacterium]
MKRNILKVVKIVLATILALAVIGWIAYNVVQGFIDGDFTQQYQLYLFAGFVILAITLVVVALVSKDKKGYSAKSIAFGAVCIALSFALSYVKLFRMPQGGSVTAGSIVLLLLYSWYFGLPKGLVCCLIYGILQSIQDPWIVHPIQFILDYPLAYVTVGFVALFTNFKNKNLGLILGILTVTLLRYLCHFTSGWVFFGEYAPEGVASWIYSLGYSLYVLVDCAVAGVLTFALKNVKAVENSLLKASFTD